MATLLLTAAANAATVNASAWVAVAASAAASVVGSYADDLLFGTTTKRTGSRLANLDVQSSSEGTPIPEAVGRARLAGQVIWATKLKEVANVTTRHTGGKGGGARTKTTNYSYHGNFAVALCEGPIDRIGRIWVEGDLLDTSSLVIRLHVGGTDQPADPLIEAIEGTADTPAYRGTAYVVFEDMPLADYGNRLPQLSFEVFRRVIPAEGALGTMVEAVTLIPGAGERVYDPKVVMRGNGTVGPIFRPQTQLVAENQSWSSSEADVRIALDDLQTSLPNVKTVFLVLGWFGDDLRAGQCLIKPRVELADKQDWIGKVAAPWTVHGLGRGRVPVVSYRGGRPALGGTPDDNGVARLILELRARGLSVFLYPFLFMDIPAGNGLPDPHGRAEQPAYPWRGRITAGSADVGGDIAAFFGTVAAAEIMVSATLAGAVAVRYTGPAEWGLRRFVLHYAKLAAALNRVAPGAVSGMLVGSEFVGVTTSRDKTGAFPAVAALRALAGDVKAVCGAAFKVSYGADWTEYSGFQPADGSGDVFFHLDPLWADDHVDFVGIDNYLPLADWRDGRAHLDARNGARSIYDIDYLAANVEGGEDWDWYYASTANRADQVRTPITDGAYGKPWVFRRKDVRSFWSNLHYDRLGGVESATSTAWVPGSKPIWFTEWGVPSVDKGVNQPNVFYDPKSSESGLPYFSTGTRDDLVQRRGLEVMLRYWAETTGNNPRATSYDGPMIEKIVVWTWDARPYPAWPGRSDIWGDTDLWPRGHWLTGKVGLADLAALVGLICDRVGFTTRDLGALYGTVTGHIRTAVISPREELTALMTLYDFSVAERGGSLHVFSNGFGADMTLDKARLVRAGGDEKGDDDLILIRDQESDLPSVFSLDYTDGNRDYRAATVMARLPGTASARTLAESYGAVLDENQARAIAGRRLRDLWVGRDQARFALPPSLLALEVGDIVALGEETFRLTRVTDQGTRVVEATAAPVGAAAIALPGPALPVVQAPIIAQAGSLDILDLPALTLDQDPGRPYAAGWVAPFRGLTVLASTSGDSFALDSSLVFRATVGMTLAAFATGSTDVWDMVNVLDVTVFSGALAGASDDAVFGGANALAVQNRDGAWEIVQFAAAELVATNCYRLSRLLRGRLGTEWAMVPSLDKGALVVVLDGALVQMKVTAAERGISRLYRFGPPDRPQTDESWQQFAFTFTGVGLSPLSPVHVRGVRDGAGDLTITWVRRSRTARQWADGVDAPLGEEREAYEVDILAGGKVVRTLSAARPVCVYTAPVQIMDFGAPQSAVTVAVHQLSAMVGRGQPGRAVL